MMCIVYIIAWLLAGTVVLAPNMLALLTYKNILQLYAQIGSLVVSEQKKAF